MIQKFDTYTVYARFFPSIVSALPLFVLWYYTVRASDWKGLFEFVLSIKCLGTISMSLIFLYFYAMFVRILSKHFESRYFGSGFPTTYLMLFENDTYSNDYKERFRERVKKLFKLEPLDAAGERLDPREARKRVAEAFNHIRLRVGKGSLVFQFNVWYGFVRNALGGAIYGIIFCLLNLVAGASMEGSRPLVVSSLVLLCVYSVLLLFRKPILIQTSEAYAKQLISEFMNVPLPRSRASKLS